MSYAICASCGSYEVTRPARVKLVGGEWRIVSIGGDWECDVCRSNTIELTENPPPSKLWAGSKRKGSSNE